MCAITSEKWDIKTKSDKHQAHARAHIPRVKVERRGDDGGENERCSDGAATRMRAVKATETAAEASAVASSEDDPEADVAGDESLTVAAVESAEAAPPVRPPEGASPCSCSCCRCCMSCTRRCCRSSAPRARSSTASDSRRTSASGAERREDEAEEAAEEEKEEEGFSSFESQSSAAAEAEAVEDKDGSPCKLETCFGENSTHTMEEKSRSEQENS